MSTAITIDTKVGLVCILRQTVSIASDALLEQVVHTIGLKVASKVAPITNTSRPLTLHPFGLAVEIVSGVHDTASAIGCRELGRFTSSLISFAAACYSTHPLPACRDQRDPPQAAHLPFRAGILHVLHMHTPLVRSLPPAKSSPPYVS